MIATLENTSKHAELAALLAGHLATRFGALTQVTAADEVDVEAEDIEGTTRTYVVPAGLDAELAGDAHRRYELRVWVGTFRKVPADADGRRDSDLLAQLRVLTEDVAAELLGLHVRGVRSFRCLSVDNNPSWFPEDLRERGRYSALMQAVFFTTERV